MLKTQTTIQLTVRREKRVCDTLTPVALYLRLRDHFAEPVLLESNNFTSAEDCHSFLGFDPIGCFKVTNGQVSIRRPSGQEKRTTVTDNSTVSEAMKSFLDSIQISDKNDDGLNGLFGHINFDAVQYFDSLKFDEEKRHTDISDIKYNLYRFIISINHFKDEMEILENIPEGETSRMEEFLQKVNATNVPAFDFRRQGERYSNLTDEEFRNLVSLGKHYCQVGDVFQIVYARRFSQPYIGDDFQVYRALRTINPSPYLFYFDFGDYSIFGSSPEAQLIIKDGKAKVNPIAGTFKRTGNLVRDNELAEELIRDPKENAEHIMLVDLARNDLGRHCTNVQVRDLKSIKFYSHVIHMVSEVEGDLEADANPIRILGDTFPAGTLSGAPKYRAMQLIDKHENTNRSFYGGGIGILQFNGDLNHAIIIRSFLSKDNILHCQAGAGIVVDSQEEKELQEVNHKLGALSKALILAESIS